MDEVGREGDGDPRVPRGFRTGASLLADADTQAIVADIHGDKRAAKEYVQEIDADVVVPDKIEDSDRAIDDVLITEVDPRYQFNSEFEYYHGWSEDEGVVLLRRTESGSRVREYHPYEWYFYVSVTDALKIGAEKWKWVTERRRWARRVEPDPEFPDRYWRVYCDRSLPKFQASRVYERIGFDDAKYSWATPFFAGEQSNGIRFPLDRDRWKPIHKLLNWLEKNDVRPLEADLTPKQRFLTDYDLRIQAKYRTMFLDIETDDSVGGFDQKEEMRIVSVAWQGDRFETDPTDCGFLLLDEESDEGEERLLRELWAEMKRYDVIAAWNGTSFDFPVIFARFRARKIRADWRYLLFADPLPIFKRHFIRAGSQATSYALDSIGQSVLKIPKLEWRKGFAERYPDVPPRVIELYRREPELLREYNVRDVEILRKLEEFTGFVQIEQMFCRIGCGFVNDYSISTKVDQLLLKKGRKEGIHFPTRYWSRDRPEQYVGAYVFEPTVGLHRNVAAFDFKSLYPSMISAFNISPETIVKESERSQFDLDDVDYCSCPRFLASISDGDNGTIEEERGGSTFRIDRQGFLSQMFANTLERRKKYTQLQDQRLEVTGTTQDDLFLLYYRLAYSFKRLGLSFYGDMGNPKSRYYDTDVAEAITLCGQYFIKETSKYAQVCGFKVHYGDTDSIYVQLAPDDAEFESEEHRLSELIRIGDEFVDYCQVRYRKILENLGCNLDWNTIYLEYEDVFDRIFFVCKKRYAGKMIRHKGVATEHVEIKGLEVMRGDVARLTRGLLQSVLGAILLEEWDGERIAREIVAPEFDRVAGGGLDVEQIVISKSISKEPSKYKTKPLHVRLSEWIRDHGQQFFVGMKVEYVVTASKPKLDGKLLEHWDPSEDVYDPEYYWDRVIYPASYRVLKVCFPDGDWNSWFISVRRRRQTLVERYRRWFRDPKKVEKAMSQICENKKRYLGPDELEILRRFPRLRARR